MFLKARLELSRSRMVPPIRCQTVTRKVLRIIRESLVLLKVSSSLVAGRVSWLVASRDAVGHPQHANDVALTAAAPPVAVTIMILNVDNVFASSAAPYSHGVRRRQ